MRVRSLFFLVAATFATLVFQSCVYDKLPRPTWSCKDSSAATYANDIKSIIEFNCIVCHNPNGSYPSVPLTSYDEVKSACINNKLLNAIKQDGTTPAMPQGQQKLSQSQIDKVECWINNSFPH